jgi:hypothetical protein
LNGACRWQIGGLDGADAVATEGVTPCPSFEGCWRDRMQFVQLKRREFIGPLAASAQAVVGLG